MVIVSAGRRAEELVARERAAGESVFVECDDNAAIRRLGIEADKHDVDAAGRLECYLILNDQTSLWLLQTVGLSRAIESKLDVFASTMEDLLAKTLFVKLPGMETCFPSLDRQPISRESESTVHLVIAGFSAQAEALAINAALVAHYPNYCRDTRLRTRITIIDDNIFDCRDHLTQRYIHLFENSFYRTIDLNVTDPHCVLHRPMYEGVRKDFVDVEWEFVNGNTRNEAVRRKLSEWCVDDRRQLTLAFCHADPDRNYNEAFGLPEAIYLNEIPVLCHTEDDDILHVATADGAYKSIYPFGAKSCDINTLRVLRRLALRVNYVYSHCFALKKGDPITAPASIDEAKMAEWWESVGSLPKCYSNYFNAMTLGTKMHSVGHSSDDWKEYYALTSDEILILQEVEHNRWNVEELILGYRPVTDDEQRQIESDASLKKVLRNTRKAHYDLRSFDDLRTDCTGKNVNVYDMALTQGIPLIIKTCITD